MVAAQKEHLDDATILCKAFKNAAKELGLSDTELGDILKKNRTTISRKKIIEPSSYEGEIACYLIRIYRSLSALVGNNSGAIAHYMKTNNLLTDGIPKEQIKTIDGLVNIMNTLDAMRAKI